jgi:hypothetical protein
MRVNLIIIVHSDASSKCLSLSIENFILDLDQKLIKANLLT